MEERGQLTSPRTVTDMNLMLSIAVSCVLVLLSISPATGQQIRSVSTGEQVLVHRHLPPETPPSLSRMRGVVASASPDSLVIMEVGQGSRMEWRFAATDLERLQVLVPLSAAEGARRGIVYGPLSVGLIVGFAMMASGDGGDENIGRGGLFLMGGVAGAVLGIPLGLVVGAIAPGSRWVDADLPEQAGAF